VLEWHAALLRCDPEITSSRVGEDGEFGISMHARRGAPGCCPRRKEGGYEWFQSGHEQSFGTLLKRRADASLAHLV
jgi:hypothetical protein